MLQFVSHVIGKKWNAACLSFILLVCAPAQAATPSDAFQRVEHLGILVEKLLEADLFPPVLPKEPALSPSRPRHVLQLAANTFENVQQIRKINGLKVEETPSITAKEVVPDDVVNVLEEAIRSLQALGPLYNVVLDVPRPALQVNKKPDHVLARLRSVNAALIQLGAPKVLPNDVYRMVFSIKQQTTHMIKAKGLKASGQATQVKKAIPADAMKEAIGFIADLDQLSKKSAHLALPNGVARPPLPKKGEKTTPSHVLLATQFALADVYSLSVALGNKDSLILPPPNAGKNPADVKNLLAEARNDLKALEQIK